MKQKRKKDKVLEEYLREDKNEGITLKEQRKNRIKMTVPQQMMIKYNIHYSLRELKSCSV
jgi:hypothetical protein